MTDLGSTNGMRSAATGSPRRSSRRVAGAHRQRTTMTVRVVEGLTTTCPSSPSSLIRIAYLAILWIFVLSAISVIRSGHVRRGSPRRRAAPAATGAARPQSRRSSRASGGRTDPRRGDGRLQRRRRAELDQAPILIGRGSGRGHPARGRLRVHPARSHRRVRRPVVRGGPARPTTVRRHGPHPNPRPSPSAPRSASGRRSWSCGSSPPMTHTPTARPTARPWTRRRRRPPAPAVRGGLRRRPGAQGQPGLRVRRPVVAAVCDGVGGAARGDIASATAILQLRKLDVPPTDDPDHDLPGRVAGALHRAHDRIGELVDEDPGLNGTSTTATLALFDGCGSRWARRRQPRLPLPRPGDHPAHRRPHVRPDADRRGPHHRGGGAGPPAPQPHPSRPSTGCTMRPSPTCSSSSWSLGDRAAVQRRRQRVLPDGRPADVLSSGQPGVRRCRAGPRQPRGGQLRQRHVPGSPTRSLPTPRSARARRPEAPVGAAAERRQQRRGGMGGLFRGPPRRGHRRARADPDAIPDDLPGYAITADPIDPEEARRTAAVPRRFVWVQAAARRACRHRPGLGRARLRAWSWTQQQYYVGEQDGSVVIYRGINTELRGSRSTLRDHRRAAGPAQRDRGRPGPRGHRLRQPADAEAKVQDPPPGRRPGHEHRAHEHLQQRVAG